MILSLYPPSYDRFTTSYESFHKRLHMSTPIYNIPFYSLNNLRALLFRSASCERQGINRAWARRLPPQIRDAKNAAGIRERPEGASPGRRKPSVTKPLPICYPALTRRAHNERKNNPVSYIPPLPSPPSTRGTGSSPQKPLMSDPSPSRRKPAISRYFRRSRKPKQAHIYPHGPL